LHLTTFLYTPSAIGAPHSLQHFPMVGPPKVASRTYPKSYVVWRQCSISILAQ
jgi:hypothetical protein